MYQIIPTFTLEEYLRASEHRNQWISQQYRPDAAEASFSIPGQSLALADLYRYTSLAFEDTAKPDQ